MVILDMISSMKDNVVLTGLPSECTNEFYRVYTKLAIRLCLFNNSLNRTSTLVSLQVSLRLIF